VKPIKILSLVAAMIMAMAFASTSSAMAEGYTALCKVDEFPCAEESVINHVRETSVGRRNCSSNLNVECEVLFLANVVRHR
jgi:hypothetical protein